MNIKIPSYEILNFQNEHFVGSCNGGSKVHPQPLLKTFRQLQRYETMTRWELGQILAENGFYANDVYEFLDK